MQYIKCDVSTICVGLAASFGAFLLAGGTKGKRFACCHPAPFLVNAVCQYAISAVRLRCAVIPSAKGERKCHINDHIEEDLPLDKIAKELHYSKFYMARILRYVCGVQ